MVVAVMVVVAAAAAVEGMVVAAAVAKVLVEKEAEGSSHQIKKTNSQQKSSHRGAPQGRVHQHRRESCMDHILGLKKGDKRLGEEGPKGTNCLVISFSLPTT